MRDIENTERRQELHTEVADVIAERRVQSDDISWVTPTGITSSIDVLTDLPQEHLSDDAFSSVRMADVGCGAGLLTAALADAYPTSTVFGIEYAPNAYRTAQQRLAAKENTTIIGGDASEVLPEVSSFNFVYAINMVQDTENPVQMLEKLSQTLKPDGVLAVTVPGQQATDIFPEFTHYDDELDLPYMKMEDITVDGATTTWKQYAFPDERFTEIVRDCGLQIIDRTELTADAAGLLYPMKLLGDEDRIEWAESLVAEQQDNPEAGPTVSLYVMGPETP